ncbi:MAG: tape measure protein, partial [bacterium]
MMEEFGDLQEAATDLKVFLGEEFGEESANAFRKIARESSLTTKGLIKNARVWASYGLETENIVDMVERLGIAAGGEREAFDNLTRAMAQVNAAGKLMGQEKNQLINAGFSLKIIADEAGVSMTNFAKAMEEGAISAKHVNDALIKATSEGGLYFGRLEKKSQTLNGQLDLVANNFNDLFANLGESKSGFFSTILSQLNETLSDVSSVISKANELEKLRREVEQLRARAAGKESTSQQKKESYKSWLARGMETYGQVKSDFTLFPNDAKYEKARAEFPGITKAADHFLGMTVATAALFDELTTSAEDAEAKRKAEIQSLQKEKSILKQRVGDDPTKGTGGDPNVLTGTTAENLAEAAKQAAGLPG